MLAQMLDTINRRLGGTFNVTCNPGESWTRPAPETRGDSRTFTINIGETDDCRKKVALVHELGELWAFAMGWPIHDISKGPRDDSHAWGTDLEKIFCLRCCCPCPGDIRQKNPMPGRSLLQ